MNKEERRRLEAQKRKRKANLAKGGVVALTVIVAITIGYIGLAA